MGIPYPSLIHEDIGQLHVAEKAARDKARADRVRLLRFLKEGRVANVSQAAAVLGYRVRTVQRWWQCYRAGGLAALLARSPQRARPERLTPEAWAGLQAKMQAGQIGGLHEAQVYLRDTWHIGYGIDALSKLFQRRKTKLKTGRPRHRKAASPAEQAAFKKGAGSHGVPTRRPAGVRDGGGPLRLESDSSPAVVPVRQPPAVGS